MTDEKKCERIDTVVGQIMETNPPDIGWMNGELAHRLLQTFEAGRTRFFMQLLREGLDKEEAKRQVAMQIPLIALDLGVKIGTELEAARQLREMFGEE